MLFLKNEKRKIKTLVEAPNFDITIMSLILIDAIILGVMTSDSVNIQGLFVLDRMFVGIFIVEMLLKVFVYGKSFFKTGWNIFDFSIVAVSSVPMASSFIILRTFRLFRLFKYIGQNSKLNEIFETFLGLIKSFVSLILILGIFFYVFAIIGVSLYGTVFVEFSNLGSAVFALIQIFTLDGWASTIARPVMSIFPSSCFYFISFVLISFLIITSFFVSAINHINQSLTKKN